MVAPEEPIEDAAKEFEQYKEVEPQIEEPKPVNEAKAAVVQVAAKLPERINLPEKETPTMTEVTRAQVFGPLKQAKVINEV